MKNLLALTAVAAVSFAGADTAKADHCSVSPYGGGYGVQSQSYLGQSYYGRSIPTAVTGTETIPTKATETTTETVTETITPRPAVTRMATFMLRAATTTFEARATTDTETRITEEAAFSSDPATSVLVSAAKA